VRKTLESSEQAEMDLQGRGSVRFQTVPDEKKGLRNNSDRN